MKLSLAEGLYLIALDDEEGRLLTAAEKTIVDGILSAFILELYVKKNITLSNTVIEVIDTSGTGNGIMDKVLKQVQSGQKLTDQISSMHDHFRNIKSEMDEFLTQRGILRREETKLLWIPLSQRMDNANYNFESGIRKALRGIVFEGVTPTPAFVILLSLIYDCGVLDEVFPDKDEYIDAVKVAKDIVTSNVIDSELSLCLVELKRFFNK